MRWCRVVKQVMKQTRARIFRGDTRARRQDPQPVRAIDGDHSQGQGGQAQRVRQDGEVAGGRKPDHHRLRSLCSATARFGPADRSHRDASSDAGTRRRAWWRQTPPSTPPRMRQPRKQKASSASAFPTARPRALNANASRGSAGSATARNGAPDARAASAWSSDDMGLTVAATKAIAGMKRWVGLGVIADNVINIGRAMEKRAAR